MLLPVRPSVPPLFRFVRSQVFQQPGTKERRRGGGEACVFFSARARLSAALLPVSAREESRSRCLRKRMFHVHRGRRLLLLGPARSPAAEYLPAWQEIPPTAAVATKKQMSNRGEERTRREKREEGTWQAEQRRRRRHLPPSLALRCAVKRMQLIQEGKETQTADGRTDEERGKRKEASGL